MQNLRADKADGALMELHHALRMQRNKDELYSTSRGLKSLSIVHVLPKFTCLFAVKHFQVGVSQSDGCDLFNLENAVAAPAFQAVTCGFSSIPRPLGSFET